MTALSIGKMLLNKYLFKMLCSRDSNRIKNIIAIFGGSSTVVRTTEVVDIVMEKVASIKEDMTNVNVLYIGAATYDIPSYEVTQTSGFNPYQNVTVDFLRIANDPPAGQMQRFLAECEAKVRACDVVLVGGGNTLYLVDRMRKFGIIDMLRAELQTRKLVLTGGSAGAIVWTDSGHSDSADPKTYKGYMEAVYNGEPVVDPPNSSDWEYIRVPGISFLPGMICPHADSTQSNGILRETDFDEMIKRHPTETGICLDNWGYFVVDGDKYEHRVYPSMTANELVNGSDRTTDVKIKRVINGELQTLYLPGSGKTSEIFKEPKNGVTTVDPKIFPVREANI